MPSNLEPPEQAPPAARHGWISHALATVVLVASLLLVLVYWHNMQERGLRTAEADFQSTNRQVLRLLQQRIINFELLVRGGASLQTSLPRPSREQWQRYVAGLDMVMRFPSVQALGFALDVNAQQLDALRQALPGVVWGASTPDFTDAQGRHALVLYAAPEQGANKGISGIDLAAHPGRRHAMEQAATTGELRISAPVPPILAAEDDPAREFVVFAPVYAPGRDGPHLQDLRGWVFIEVDAAGFVRAALQAFERASQLRIVDATDGEGRLVYADQDFLGELAGELDDSMRPAFVQSLRLDIMGRHWRVDFESEPMAEVRNTIPGLRTTLLGGLLGSLLLFGIALNLARTQSRAEALAAQMSASYRRSEQRFRSAMRYSAIGKALLDRDGRIVEANPAMGQILGINEQALVGTTLGQHFVDGEYDTMRTVEREALSEGAYRVTRRLRRSDGDVRHASLTFAMVPGEVGEHFASLVQVEDVTERMRAEARVQALNRTLEARVALRTRELSHANQELEAFAYSVSHDLRAPLRSIDGFSRLLSERYRDSIDVSGQDYLKRIRSASARMSDLIDALLKMSRVSRGELKYAQVDLTAMAHDIAAELRNSEPSRQVAFDIAPGLVAQGDPALLRNLMDNLMGNAWKFTRACKDARIEVGRNGEGEFFVRDNGAGFAPEYAAKLFRPFQRLHTQAEYAGHGIGLASVKRVVERHGGSIRAEGEVGKGATFVFGLPQAPVAE